MFFSFHKLYILLIESNANIFLWINRQQNKLINLYKYTISSFSSMCVLILLKVCFYETYRQLKATDACSILADI